MCCVAVCLSVLESTVEAHEKAKPKQFNAMVKIKFDCAIVYGKCANIHTTYERQK